MWKICNKRDIFSLYLPSDAILEESKKEFYQHFNIKLFI